MWTSTAGVRRIEFGALPRERHTDAAGERPPLLAAGDRRSFDVELDLSGVTSDFQRDVYERLREVPYGRVVSYGRIAEDIGKPDQARAVGQAVGANPIPIIIPCHRVIGSDGRLTGFSGGLAAKVSLLRLEGIDVDGPTASSRVHPEVIPLDLH